MIVDVIGMAYALFERVPFYLECTTGETMIGLLIPQSKLNEEGAYKLLPNFSYAHVAQVYFRHKYGDSGLPQEYELNTYPTFPLLIQEDQRELEATFSQKAHWFTSDHFLEDEYLDFSETYRIERAKEWCKENGIALYYAAEKWGRSVNEGDEGAEDHNVPHST